MSEAKWLSRDAEGLPEQMHITGAVIISGGL